mgnify:CR=1 FL=1
MDKTVTLELTGAEAVDIVRVLDGLPTSSNAWPLVQKLKGQLDPQLPQNPAPEEDAAPAA